MNEPAKCFSCSRPAETGMFCRWHNWLECLYSYVSANWTDREDMNGLSDHMSKRNLKQLQDFARENRAGQLMHLSARVSQLGGPHADALYNHLRTWVAKRKDLAPERGTVAIDIPAPTVEARDESADLEPWDLSF